MVIKLFEAKDNSLRFAVLIIFFLVLISNASSYPEDWDFVGNAYIDEANQNAVLTKNENDQVGAIWLKDDNIVGPITARFRYKVGGGSRGADGLVFMFYKEFEGNPPGGLNLGFGDHGYGIEFDSSPNQGAGDPTCDHVALIRDNTVKHLCPRCFNEIDDFTEINDNQWHNVEVQIGDTTVTAKVDGRVVLQCDPNIGKADYLGFDQTYGRIGFSAATGGGNDWHRIDDVYIKYYIIKFSASGVVRHKQHARLYQ
jgi:hypothetical protein